MWLGKKGVQIQLSEARIVLADFGEAFFPSQEAKYESYSPLAIRPPESRFEPTRPLSFPSDIWMLACTIWEILGHRSLFGDTFLNTDDEVTRDQIDVLTDFPSEWWTKWEARPKWFTDTGEPTRVEDLRSLEEHFDFCVRRKRVGSGVYVAQATGVCCRV
jgi:hypothetical protein